MFQEIILRTWHLAIIQHLFAVSDEPIAGLFQWIGGVSAHGEPSFACKPRQLWSDVSSDFKLSSHVLMDVKLLVVNQVRGVYIHLDPICPSTTNSIDGGIQSSDSGPDIFSPVIPTAWVYRDDGSFDFNDVKINNFFTAETLPKTYIPNPQYHKGWHKVKTKRKSCASTIAKKWMSVARWKPIRELVGSFFIVTTHDGQPLSKHQCTYLDPLLKDKVLLPNLPSFCDKFYMKQTFHAMTNDQRQQVIQAFELGINEDKFDSIIHSILQQHRQQSYISTEKIEKTIKDKHHNGFIQIFAGGGAPPLNTEFKSYQFASSLITVCHHSCPIEEMDQYISP